MVTLAAFLEPRGFMKILQLGFVISAFACICDFRGDVVVNLCCDSYIENTTTPTGMPPPLNDTSEFNEDGSCEYPKEFIASFKYPFNLEKSQSEKALNCEEKDAVLTLSGNYSSPAAFFVFVGVSAMLLVLLLIGVYIVMDSQYKLADWMPLCDMIMHVIYTVMWFAGSISWAAALTSIKKYTELDQIIKHNPEICGIENTAECTSEKIYWLLLDLSDVFGFLNVILFGVNIWFVFKETKFSTPAPMPTIT